MAHDGTCQNRTGQQYAESDSWISGSHRSTPIPLVPPAVQALAARGLRCGFVQTDVRKRCANHDKNNENAPNPHQLARAATRSGSVVRRVLMVFTRSCRRSSSRVARLLASRGGTSRSIASTSPCRRGRGISHTSLWHLPCRPRQRVSSGQPHDQRAKTGRLGCLTRGVVIGFICGRLAKWRGVWATHRSSSALATFLGSRAGFAGGEVAAGLRVDGLNEGFVSGGASGARFLA